jgi:hypothetical protein
MSKICFAFVPKILRPNHAHVKRILVSDPKVDARPVLMWLEMAVHDVGTKDDGWGNSPGEEWSDRRFPQSPMLGQRSYQYRSAML